MGANCSCQKEQLTDDYNNQIVVNGTPSKVQHAATPQPGPINDFNVALDQPYFKREVPVGGSSNSYIYNSLVGSERRIKAADSQFAGLKSIERSARELATYDGELVEGLPNGKGKEIYKNGDEYMGQFVYGKKHGYGILYSPGKFKYSGNFQNNKMNGYGTIEYENGSVYRGEFKNAEFHGTGTFIDNNGNERTGLWESGTFVG